MIDVLIVGGGPTGLGAAILAAEAGLHATILEPRPGPIDKACGEGLMPAAAAMLARMGASPAASHPFLGIRYIDGESTAEGRFPQGPGLGVRRTALHAEQAGNLFHPIIVFSAKVAAGAQDPIDQAVCLFSTF